PGLTTPEPVTLHAQLADIAEAGISHLALEASSHGLAQRRLDGVKIAAAGFTNLSRDHLDYHASFEEYFAAKARLFDTCVAEGGLAVINADSDQSEALSDIATRRNLTLIGYGASGREFRVVARQPTPGGCELELEILGQTAKVDLPLIGSYQTANALCALGLAMADTALSADTLINGLASLPSVPGRLEKVGISARGGAVYVDYAHTPDALETVLKALREHTAGTLGVVFGCGGDRDPGKRPQMGRAAATLADWAIVTDDNPRTEDPASIRAEALAACPDAREIGDRRQAIEAAIEALQDGDVLVLAGKGHEPYQIVGKQTLPFDDRDVARQTLAASGGTA
ncbi:MAG: UDP-N-acetylmuramoyl-L-alanyl-D-glutamate--2,6-diaminopimelate ligase, partial [Pseudomonadota bacterium]